MTRLQWPWAVPDVCASAHLSNNQRQQLQVAQPCWKSSVCYCWFCWLIPSFLIPSADETALCRANSPQITSWESALPSAEHLLTFPSPHDSRLVFFRMTTSLNSSRKPRGAKTASQKAADSVGRGADKWTRWAWSRSRPRAPTSAQANYCDSLWQMIPAKVQHKAIGPS